jgi:hypothetical protein
MKEIVYILTNPTIPDLIKIGRTTNLEDRLRNLSSHSGVPIPFEVFYACQVDDAVKVERHIHEGFGDHRVNPKREFFRVNPERVLAILKLVEISDVTPTEDVVEDEEDRQTLSRERSRRQTFRFSLVQIPVGSTLHFVRDESITAKVFDDRNIEFEGEITSLSQSTLKILTRNYGKTWLTVRGPDYWVYKDKTLSERKIELEE